MTTLVPQTSACRHCRHYSPQGRRGGHCQQLGAPVQSEWLACPLARSAFKSAWELLEEVPPCQGAGLAIQEVYVGSYAYLESQERLTLGQFVG